MLLLYALFRRPLGMSSAERGCEGVPNSRGPEANALCCSTDPGFDGSGLLLTGVPPL
jgi:hypothetical protein